MGFKWFVPGLLDGSVGFGGEESAGASFLQMDGGVWTTDKDGLILDLLAAEITAKTGKDPGAHFEELAAKFGTPFYTRVDAPASPAEKAALKKLDPAAVSASTLAGEPIVAKLTRAPGNDAPIGGLKVVTGNGWFAARPSGTENVYKIYAESMTSAAHLDAILKEAREIVARALGAKIADVSAARDLAGRVAVVVGGTSGIGRALAVGLAEAGADVVATGRRAALVDEVARGDRGARAAHAAPAVRRRRPRVARGAARRDARRLRARRRPRELRGQDQAHADARGERGRVERHPRHQPHGYAARLSGLRAAHARARLRAHRQHRLALDVRRALRGRGLRGQQGGGGVAHEVARPRVGPARRVRQRHRAGGLPDRHQPRAARRHRARPRVPRCARP